MPSDLGPDGTVRLRCYLPLADRLYFAGPCPGCARVVTVGVRAAVELMGSAEATFGQLEARLRCRPCDRRVSLIVCPDVRNQEARQKDGPLPETGGLRVTGNDLIGPLAQERARPT